MSRYPWPWRLPELQAKPWDHVMQSAASCFVVIQDQRTATATSRAGTVRLPQMVRYDHTKQVRVAEITNSVQASCASAGAMRF